MAEEINARGIFEEEILHKIMTDGEYFGSVVPYFKTKYFSEIGNSIVFKTIDNFYSDTGAQPNIKDLIVLLKDAPKTDRQVASEALKKIMKSDTRVNGDLLIEKTEDFIKKAIHTESLITGAEGMQENNQQKIADSFQIAEEAQKVSLDDDFGMEYEDIDERVDYYQNPESGLLPGIPSIDAMLGKGVTSKTLSFFLAPPGIGKSASLVAFAAEFAKQGHDVVMISLEMREEEYWKRLDSNLLNIPIQDLEKIDPLVIKQKHEQQNPGLGRIIVKEFPSYELTALKLTSFLEKLENKTGIKKPIVFVDYLQLMSSDRLKDSSDSYGYIKSITSELRAVAQRRDLAIFSASQLNRAAVGNLEAGQETVSDSAGISMFADMLIFLLQTKQMKELGEIMINFEKNRFSGKTYSFKIGFDYSHMRFCDKFNNEQQIQSIEVNDGLDLPANPLDSMLN